MRTNKAPYDYNRRTPILPQLVDVCLKCGGACYLRPSDGKRACIFCHSTETDKLYENQLDVFVGGLMQIEHDKALVFVGKLADQTETLRESLNIVADVELDMENIINKQLLMDQ